MIPKINFIAFSKTQVIANQRNRVYGSEKNLHRWQDWYTNSESKTIINHVCIINSNIAHLNIQIKYYYTHVLGGETNWLNTVYPKGGLFPRPTQNEGGDPESVSSVCSLCPDKGLVTIPTEDTPLLSQQPPEYNNYTVQWAVLPT